MMTVKNATFQACRLYIAIILLGSAQAHIANPFAFVLSSYRYDLVHSEMYLVLAALILPAIHCALAVGLILKPEFKTVYVGCAMLMLCYALLQLRAISTGMDISCGCFSHGSATSISWGTLVVPLSVLVATCWCGLMRPPAPDSTSHGLGDALGNPIM